MKGYRVIASPSREVLDTELVWMLQFPAESERIVSTISKSQNGKEEVVDGGGGGVSTKGKRDRQIMCVGGGRGEGDRGYEEGQRL